MARDRAAVPALVVGLAVGFVTGGGTSSESSVATVETAPQSAPPTSAAPDPDTPQPCLTAGAAATQVLQELEAAVAAVGALDPTAVRQILDRLQPVQGELQVAVAACGSRFESTTPAPGPTG